MIEESPEAPHVEAGSNNAFSKGSLSLLGGAIRAAAMESLLQQAPSLASRLSSRGASADVTLHFQLNGQLQQGLAVQGLQLRRASSGNGYVYGYERGAYAA